MDQDFTLLELENSCKHAYNRLSIAVFNLDLSRFVEDNKVFIQIIFELFLIKIIFLLGQSYFSSFSVFFHKTSWGPSIHLSNSGYKRF